ncbi:Permease of the drug/metabolite transporter (DMT) superfamily [Albimonas donghaensis]|uniref:Permease of the drug/metabolite transporter (DMT) superfamily n=1 Tax=Albimonas donghaensis TaxID=356660 RepID=A0A1H3AL90_9RHOB|nr:DMT family transporter [Albimonas donghaensis]SDX30446.1 Permease of the drug/metabolite transporter (DMT) superfamily [Albimonas donghaensis]
MTSAPDPTAPLAAGEGRSRDDRPLAAAAWMCGALCCFSAMAVSGREAAAELDTFELMFYRSVIGAVVVIGALIFAGKMREVRARRLGLHLGRNIAHFAGQNLWFLSVTLLPLAQVFAYEFTNPLWVAMLAPLLLGERFRWSRLGAAAIGFTGILVVAQPWQAGGAVGGFGIGQLAALGAALGFAFTVMSTKVLGRTESTASILFFMTVMQAAMGLVCAGWDGDMAFPAATLPWVVLVAFCGLGAHFCVTTALSKAPASIVSPMEFARLPMIAVVGMLMYGEPLEWSLVAGAALVLGGNFLNLRAERRRAAG